MLMFSNNRMPVLGETHVFIQSSTFIIQTKKALNSRDCTSHAVNDRSGGEGLGALLAYPLICILLNYSVTYMLPPEYRGTLMPKFNNPASGAWPMCRDMFGQIAK